MAGPSTSDAAGRKPEHSRAVNATADEIASADAASRSLYRWVIEHDDRRLFLVGYIVLSIVLSIAISLFWLLVLIAIHLLLELVKKRHDGAGSLRRTLAWALWDVKFDLALLVMAFMLLVYTSISVGILGIGGASLGASRSLHGLVAAMPISPRDFILAARIIGLRQLDRREILRRRRQRRTTGPSDAARASRIAAVRYPWQATWSFAEKLALLFVLVNVSAIALGFYVAEETPRQVLAAMLQQLHPWPGSSG